VRVWSPEVPSTPLKHALDLFSIDKERQRYKNRFLLLSKVHVGQSGREKKEQRKFVAITITSNKIHPTCILPELVYTRPVFYRPARTDRSISAYPISASRTNKVTSTFYRHKILLLVLSSLFLPFLSLNFPFIMKKYRSSSFALCLFLFQCHRSIYNVNPSLSNCRC